MINKTSSERTILRNLEGSLVMRRSRPEDAEALAEFNARIHSDDGPEKPDARLAAWVRDLLLKPHPTFNPDDFTIVEEAETGRIVSSLNLINQTWTYAGIPFGVGRPELVGTLPEYRNRGLVRAQFEVAHQWSAERGHKLQAITGIPYYYRLFGYEMTVNLGGGRAGFRPHIPALKEGEMEPYRIRPAVEADAGFILEVYEYGTQRSLLRCVLNEDLLRYEISGKDNQNVNRIVLQIIETQTGEPVGYFGHPHFAWGNMFPAQVYELKQGVSWAEATPTVIRFLVQAGDAMLEGKPERLEAFGFWLGQEHPVYSVIQDRLPRVRKPYAWYIRVADLPDFLRHITRVLEDRLNSSVMAGHTGELKISFYRSGLKITFEQGRVALVEPWLPEPHPHSGDAGFPELTFLQLLFGYRTLEEISYIFPDCFTNGDIPRQLLEALFPRQPSDVIPVS